MATNPAARAVAADTKAWFRPAETSPHRCTLMAYPNAKSKPFQNLLQAAQAEVTAIAIAIAEFEPVVLFASTETVEDAESRTSDRVSVERLDETSHLWIRDFGPVFVKSADGSSLCGVNFNFDCYGGKRAPSGEQQLAEIVARRISGDDLLSTWIIAEGGGMEVDGEGTFMGTESAVIHRNPGDRSRTQIESELGRVLGVKSFIWLPGEIGKEMTDCHIDAHARFVGPRQIVLSKPSAATPGPFVTAYHAAVEKLGKMLDTEGRPLVVHDCTEPDVSKLAGVDKDHIEGDLVPSYVNFLAVNGGLIIPKFGDEQRDAEAMVLFKELFPERKVVQVYLNALPRLGGGIHCSTQEVPALG